MTYPDRFERSKRRATALRGPAAVAMALTAALALSACGDSDSDEGSGGAASTSAKSTATKEPYKIAFISPVNAPAGTAFPVNSEVAKAYATALNTKGGINGHPLEISFCDDKSDPNQTAACGRKAVQEKVIAAQGFTYNGDQLLPILTKAGIAWVPGGSASSTSENTSKVSFPNTASYLATVGLGQLAASRCKNPSMMSAQFAGAAFILKLTNAGLTASGAKPIPKDRYITYPTSTTDYASIVAKVMSGKPDCLLLPVSLESASGIYSALRAANQTPQIIGNQGTTITAESIKQFPEQTQGGLLSGLVSQYDGAAWADMREAVEKYASKKYDYAGIQPQGTWLGMEVMKEVLSKVPGTPTAASVLEQFNASTAIDVGDKAPPIDFSKEWTVDEFPRYFVRSLVYSQVEDGKIVPAFGGKFFDVGPAVEGKKVAPPQ